MSQRLENNILLKEDSVAKYFPDDIVDLFGLSKDQVSFFGIHNFGIGNFHNGRRKFWNKYLAVLNDSSTTDLNLSFSKSSSHWIEGEHSRFLDLQKNKYPDSLFNKYPLLLLRLSSNNIGLDEDFKYVTLLRYADHDQYRNRGIATKVFDSVSKGCKSDGISYLHMDADFKIPSKSFWLGQGEVSGVDLKKIHSFSGVYIDNILPFKRSYLRILT